MCLAVYRSLSRSARSSNAQVTHNAKLRAVAQPQRFAFILVSITHVCCVVNIILGKVCAYEKPNPQSWNDIICLSSDFGVSHQQMVAHLYLFAHLCTAVSECTQILTYKPNQTLSCYT